MHASAARRLRRSVAAMVIAVVAGGCASGPPEEAYRLPPTTLEVRELQTRTFEADEAEIIGACVALLQDMEYNIDAIEIPLGVLSASKVVDADSATQKAGLVAADVAMVILSVISGTSVGGGAYASADDEIGLKITLVVRPSLAGGDQYTVRITLQRTLIDKSARVKEVGVINDPIVYQEIFEKLSKSLYLQEEVR